VMIMVTFASFFLWRNKIQNLKKKIWS
jgi:hypothetical protein